MPPPAPYARPGIVSVWVSDLAGPDAAEVYFAEEYDALDVPEAPVHWEPSAFQRDLGLGFFPPWQLETNFPGPPARPLAELISEIAFAETFGPLALAAAADQRTTTAAGVACVFHLDYRLKPGWRDAVGPVRFVGAFAFVHYEPQEAAQYQAVTDRLGVYDGAVFLVAGLLADCTRNRPAGHMKFSAAEFANFLRAQSPEVIDLLRAHRLGTSEAVGRVVFGLVDAGLAGKSPHEKPSDFDRLFDLGRGDR